MVKNLAKGLAVAFLAGQWTEGGMVARGWEALGTGAQGPELALWLRQVVQWLLDKFHWFFLKVGYCSPKIEILYANNKNSIFINIK